jgi:casein kinase 1
MSGQQQGAVPIPPSPALVRNGSARRKIPAALQPGVASGQATPGSAAAHVGVPPPGERRGSAHLTPQHPFASAQGSYEFPPPDGEDGYPAQGQQSYGRQSPMVASAAPPAMTPVRAHAGEVGVANGEHDQRGADEQPSSFWKCLTCKCG